MYSSVEHPTPLDVQNRLAQNHMNSSTDIAYCLYSRFTHNDPTGEESDVLITIHAAQDLLNALIPADIRPKRGISFVIGWL